MTTIEQQPQDALDRSKPGSTGHQKHRPLMVVAQVGCTHRPPERDLIAHRKLFGHMGTGTTARHLAHMELEQAFARNARHRILPLESGDELQ